MAAESQVLFGLDTNVLLRYILADDPEQHALAVDLIEGRCTRERPGLIHPVALCEVVWAMRQVYKVPKADVLETLNVLLRIETLVVLDEALVVDAVEKYDSTGRIDFADALLHAAYQKAGGGFATFDRSASRLPGAFVPTTD